jgi:tetraacyldisaccharide 4'-kinase
VEDGAGCVILDDGFQRRWQLGRDLDLLLADYDEVLAGERLLPAGPFREPWSQAAQADAVLVSGAPAGLAAAALRRALPSAWTRGPVFRLDRAPLRLETWPQGRRLPLARLRGSRVLALSGVGRPQSFEDGLAALGADVHAWRFGDHHPYTLAELQRPPQAARTAAPAPGRPRKARPGGPAAIVTTAKDAARLPKEWKPGIPVWVLVVEARVAPLAPFWTLVDAALRRTAAERTP